MSNTYWRLTEENWDGDCSVWVFRSKPTVDEIINTTNMDLVDAKVLLENGTFRIPYCYGFWLAETEFDN